MLNCTDRMCGAYDCAHCHPGSWEEADEGDEGDEDAPRDTYEPDRRDDATREDWE